VSEVSKLFVYCCRLLEEGRRKNHYFLLEFDINHRVTLVGKNTLDASLYTWILNEWISKE
jgi:hypothetical protein